MRPQRKRWGIRYRECQNCYARETEYLPIVKDVLEMTLLQYGTGIEVAVGGTVLSNEQTADVAVGGSFTVADETECVVAYSTDSGETLSRLAGSLVSEEDNMYQYTLPDTVEEDITLYVIRRGDTTGDGKIDLFDVYEIRDYLLVTDPADSNLKGIFYLAGCVTDDDIIDLFDTLDRVLFDVTEIMGYIKTGTFSG